MSEYIGKSPYIEVKPGKIASFYLFPRKHRVIDQSGTTTGKSGKICEEEGYYKYMSVV